MHGRFLGLFVVLVSAAKQYNQNCSSRILIELTDAEGGMGRMSPVQLAPLECSRHDCAAASGQLPSEQLHTKLHRTLQALACGLPLTLSAQRHGDFPRSMLRSELPVCWLRGRASSASFVMLVSAFHLWLPKNILASTSAFVQVHREATKLYNPRVTELTVAEGGMGRMSPVQLAPSRVLTA